MAGTFIEEVSDLLGTALNLASEVDQPLLRIQLQELLLNAERLCFNHADVCPECRMEKDELASQAHQVLP